MQHSPIAARRRLPGLILTGLLGTGLLAGCEQDTPPEPAAAETPRFKETFHASAYEKDFGYSQVVRIGKTLYVSGTVPADSQGLLVSPDNLEGQLTAVYENLRRTLASQGASFDHVVMERIYTTDMPALLAVADLRFKYYDRDNLPAVTWVEVSRLVDPGFMVAIDLVAELP